MITKPKRKKMEDLIYKIFSTLDKSGINTNKYKDMFNEMSDKQFDSFFKKFFNDEHAYLTLDSIDYEHKHKLADVEEAAEILKVPLFEKIIMPHINMDKEKPSISKHEVPVGYLHLKRMQQMVFKKNSMSTDISIRSSITGQVTAADKNARETDSENFALMSLGIEHGMKEFMGPRSDDIVAKDEMYGAIAKKGYVSLKELTDNVDNKVTLNTLDVYLIGAGIKSDLITKGIYLRKTLNSRNKQ